jgi:ADP-ribosylglycohydrolase
MENSSKNNPNKKVNVLKSVNLENDTDITAAITRG